MRKLAMALLLTLAAACAGGDDGPATGIEGQVLAGPQCLVEVAGSPCPDEPLAAMLGIRRAGSLHGSPIAAGDDGRFRIELEPGDYEIVPLPIAGNPIPLPPGPIAITVVEGVMVEITVTYDAGIR